MCVCVCDMTHKPYLYVTNSRIVFLSCQFNGAYVCVCDMTHELYHVCVCDVTDLHVRDTTH